MRGVVCLMASAIISLSNVVYAARQIADAKPRKSTEELSVSTLVDEKGWAVAERLLHPNFARWAMGQIYERREKFVRSLEEWWNYGMRVAEREVEMIAVYVNGDLAIAHCKTTESFIGPDGSV